MPCRGTVCNFRERRCKIGLNFSKGYVRFGSKQTFASQKAMSALPPKADIQRALEIMGAYDLVFIYWQVGDRGDRDAKSKRHSDCGYSHFCFASRREHPLCVHNRTRR